VVIRFNSNMSERETADRTPSRRNWRNTVRDWGPDGNERLTTAAALVLLALLALETLTTLSLSSYLAVHIFLGLLLLPPVGLKLASVGWRFVRYYTRSNPYRLKGPPELLLRLLAPFLVVSTMTLLGSGVALIATTHRGGLLLTLHVASFVVWGVLMAVHVLIYLTRTLRAGTADWRRRADLVAGAGGRRLALVCALLAGVVVALGTYSVQRSWLSHRRESRHGERGLQAPKTANRRSLSV
jgi:hypothetical protein